MARFRMILKKTGPLCLFFAIAVFFCGNRPAWGVDSVDFARDVRPILARHCLKCHGPDDNKRAVGLRLDSSKGLFGETKSGVIAVVPGNPEESELIARIHSDDDSEIMPPPETKDPLSPEQKRILNQWVADGAKFEQHWAFIPPVRPVVPSVESMPEPWTKNPIDAFVYQKLLETGLKPQPPADRRTMIRRLSLDLIGLPPTPQEVQSFLSDTRPDAYERLVDRLLDSPHYGERWARKWLDLARYADTNGYEKDRPRSIWPYRDWVIDALNSDMPFDQFTIRQIAGDMLPNATQADKVATGFHRNTMLNEEGGIDPLEYRFYAMVDRVGTTGTVWMGMSVACAQCHTHKYDPITQTDYYRLMAAMNNAEEPPLFEMSDSESQRKNQEIDAQIATLINNLPNRFPAEQPKADSELRSENQRREDARSKAFDAWRSEKLAITAPWSLLSPNSMKANLARLEQRDDGSIFATGDATKHDEYELLFDSIPAGTTAIRLEVLPDPALPVGGPGRTDYEGPLGDFFLSEFQLRGADGSQNPLLKLTSATESYGKLGIGGGSAKAELALDGNMQTGWSAHGHQGKEDQAVFVFENPLPEPASARLTMIFERHYSAPLGRFRLWTTTSSTGIQAKSIPTRIETLLVKSAVGLSEQERAELERYWLRFEASELADARREIENLESSRPKPVTTLVMRERPSDFSRPTFVHRRGEFLQPTSTVTPGTPGFLKPELSSKPIRNRLELAQWLVSEENPLAARVTVNRQWAALFGRGLVRTQEDFGYQGELPTHPQLLDWLARTFVDNDQWSLKRLHRRIVTSATYRQSSHVTPESLEKDPENRFLSHAARFRMDGEVVRDSALAVAGLLSHKLGGPSVFPPQPANITTEGAYGKLNWTVSKGEDRYRRSLYTFSKRTAPFAMLNTFDAPSGESCVVRRDVSNSALQSLTLLNDPIFMEAAQALGRKFGSVQKPDQDSLNQLFDQLFSRLPEPSENELMVQFINKLRQDLSKKPDQARHLAGNLKPDQNAVEVAVWTALARALLNTDEFVVHR